MSQMSTQQPQRQPYGGSLQTKHTPSLETIADATTWQQAFEPNDVNDVRQLVKDLRGSVAIPLVQRERGALKVPMSEADIFGILILGRSLGLGVMQSLNGIYIVEGRPMLAAQTMQALVKSRQRVCLAFEMVESTAERATFRTRRAGSERWETLTWTIAMAKQAGSFNRQSSPWVTYPQAMLRARCIADLCRMVYPDLLLGLYAVEEFDTSAAIERIGGMVDMTPQVAPAATKDVSTSDGWSVAQWVALIEDSKSLETLSSMTKNLGAARRNGELSDEDYPQVLAAFKSRQAELRAAKATIPLPTPPGEQDRSAARDEMTARHAAREAAAAEQTMREPGED
jgi:hypothetical protein